MPFEVELPPLHSESRPQKAPKPSWPVLIGSALVSLAIALWAIFERDQADEVIIALVARTAENSGWYYVLTMGLIVFFVLGVAFSPARRTKLAPEPAE